MRVRNAVPCPAGIGNRARMVALSQSNLMGLPPARYGPEGSLVNCTITSPGEGAENSMARIPFSYSTVVSSAVA